MTTTDRIHFASLKAKTPAQRRRDAEAIAKQQPGWKRQFWSLLSPETAELLKTELAKK